jgi:hypothetical protein
MTVGRNTQTHVAVISTGNCLLHRVYEPATDSMSHESARSNAHSATPHIGSNVQGYRDSSNWKGQGILMLKTTEQHADVHQVRTSMKKKKKKKKKKSY